MSYDLYALSVPEGEDATAVFESLMEAEEAEEQADWTQQEIARMEMLAASLLALNPRLERFGFDYAGLARLGSITEAEARAKYRHAELTTPEGDNPIQMTINANHACLTVPYWHTGDRAAAMMAEVFTYVALLEREADWTIFDPQIGRTLSSSQDLSVVVSTYETGTRRLGDALRKESPSPVPNEPIRKKKRFGLF